MDKAKAYRAELMIRKAEQSACSAGIACKVPLIAQKRAADVRHVYAQLMRPAGDRRKRKQRRAAPAGESKRPQRFIPADSPLSIRSYDAGEAVGIFPRDGLVDDPARGRGDAKAPGAVFFCEGAFLHLVLQMRLRKRKFGKENDARRFRVQPVNGVRRAPQISAYARFERIRAAGRGRGRMALQQRRLMNGDKRVVLI